MSTNYRRARGAGKYWDKSSAVTTTRGEFVLGSGYDLEFGEPLQRDGTGYIDDVFKKKKLKPYPSDLAAGSGQVIGVGIEFYDDITSFTTEDWVLKGPDSYKNRNRDVLAVLIGAVRIVNKGATEVHIGDTVIPVDGGFEKMTANAQYSLGKALQDIPADESGLVWVNPDYEKDTI